MRLQRKLVIAAIGIALVALLAHVAWSAVCLVKHKGPAQAVEITVNIEGDKLASTSSGTNASHSSYTARCLVGTNNWVIQYNRSKHSKLSWCFTGSNLVMQTVITSEPFAEDFRQVWCWAANKVLRLNTPNPYSWRRPLHWGDKFGGVSDLILGYPPTTIDSLTWLAFCSGNFFKTRRGLWMPDLFGVKQMVFHDETTVFDDPRGLPRRVDFFGANREQWGCYKVLQTTNLFGCTFPLEFELILLDYTGANKGSPVRVSGKVTTIREVEQFEIPKALRKLLAEAPRRTNPPPQRGGR